MFKPNLLDKKVIFNRKFAKAVNRGECTWMVTHTFIEVRLNRDLGTVGLRESSRRLGTCSAAAFFWVTYRGIALSNEKFFKRFSFLKFIFFFRKIEYLLAYKTVFNAKHNDLLLCNWLF